MSIIKLSPLDKEGLRFDRPTAEVNWQKLTNVVFKDGSLVPRPGFGTVYTLTGAALAAADHYPPVFIGQINNPGSTATGRESYTLTTETVRPNASADVEAGWTGDHLDIDDTTPDGTTYMYTSTEGAFKKVEFAAMSLTYDSIWGILIRGRARIEAPNSAAILTFHMLAGATWFEIGSVYIATAGTDDGATPPGPPAASAWQDFAIPLATQPNASTICNLFDDDTFDSIALGVELESASLLASETALLGDGTYTEWKDATNGDAATYTDLVELWGNFGVWGPRPTATANGMIPAASGSSGADKRQSFTVDVSQIDEVTSVKVECLFYTTSPGEHFSLYWRTGAGVAHLVETFNLLDDTYPVFTMTTNPATSAAWTVAEIEAGEFYLQSVDGSSRSKLMSMGVQVEGTSVFTSEFVVQLDFLAIDVQGATVAANLGYDRLFSTANKHYRLAADGVGAASFTDVTNSVAVTTPSVVPLDYAVLYGQVYLVNGVDATRVYPNGSSVYTSLTTNNSDGATKLTGRTVCQHGNRILYGWTTEDTTVTPERVAYSKFNDGSTHNDVSAGDFDLLDTSGGVVKLIPINEDIVAALKEEGVYNLIKTGQAAFPYRRDLIDPFTGCVAKMTAKQVLLNGTSGILFLGENANQKGLNVYFFDGGQVTPVGNPIARKLEEDANHRVVPFSFAEVDPNTGTYWLFVAEGCDGLLPNSAWVLNLENGAWTRAEFPFHVTCAGQWTLLADPDQSTGTGQKAIRGKRTFMLGTDRAVPMYGTPEVTSDSIYATLVPGYSGLGRKAFESVIETGDLIRPNNVQVASYRLHMTFTQVNVAFRVVVSSSEDGGKTFNTEQEYQLGPSTDLTTGQKRFIYADLTPSHSHVVRYRIEMGADADATTSIDLPWQLDELRIELVETGDGA